MRKIWISALLVALVTPAGAQMGPVEARPVMSQFGGIPFPTRGKKDLSTEVTVIVTPDGYVKSTEVVDSSGDPVFDQSVQRYFQKWRFVPAVDDKGQPYESRTRIRYGSAKLVGEAAMLPRESKGTDGIQKAMVMEDAKRIPRMTCKDFLWEYGIVSSVKQAPRGSRDSLLHTPLVLYIAERNADKAEARKLNRGYDKLVREVATRCEASPDSPFWAAVMKPALQASLDR